MYPKKTRKEMTNVPDLQEILSMDKPYQNSISDSIQFFIPAGREGRTEGGREGEGGRERENME